MTAPGLKSAICPVLIGRTAILEAFDQVIDSAGEEAEPRVIVLSGEAGVGKTRLASEMKGRAANRGWKFLQGNCYETEASLPYAPLIDLLQNAYASGSTEEMKALFGPFAPELANLLPDLSPQLLDPAPTQAFEPQHAKHRLFHRLAQFIVLLAAGQPTLIVFEDMQWVDETSVEFLLYLARQLASQHSSSLLLLTQRNNEISNTQLHFLAELDRRRSVIEFIVPPLSKVEVDAMLTTTFNLSQKVQTEFLDAVYHLTEGNPFFVEEVLNSLMAAGEIYFEDSAVSDLKPISALHIPRSIQDAVQRRMERLSPAARQALIVAAVAGPRFDLALLQHLTRPSDPEQAERAEQELLNSIREIINTQFVVEETPETLAFRHALIQKAVYGMLLGREKRNLHRQVALAIEAMVADSRRFKLHLGELAYHFYEAGEWSKALEYSRQAGERAQDLLALPAAVEHFTRAIEAAHQISVEPPADLFLARGRALMDLDDFAGAQADFQTSLETAQANEDKQAEWKALLETGALWAGHDYTRCGAFLQRALTIARRLENPAALAHTLNRVGNWHLNLGDPGEARLQHEEALKIFENMQDQRGAAQTLDFLGITHYIGGDLARGTASYRQSLALFRQLNDRQGMINSLKYLTVRGRFTADVLDAPSLGQLLPDGETALQMAQDLGWRSAESTILTCLAQCLGSMGDYGRALQLAQKALEIAEEIQHFEWVSSAKWVLGFLHFELFDPAEARQLLEAALAMARQIGSALYIQDVSAGLAQALIGQNDLAQAEAVLAPLLRPGEQAEWSGRRLCWYTWAELALAKNEPNQTLQIVDRLVDSAVNIETYGRQAIPHLTFLRGRALVALGQFSQAESELLAARAVAQGQGRRPLLWRILHELGRIYQAQQRVEASVEAFSAARSVVEEMAERIPDGALRQNYLARAADTIPGPQPLSPRQAAKKAFGGLTERERAVAALVAWGKSNREIARELIVSERTAATHISNILNKLGFSSRAQIAVWAAEHGLAGASNEEEL